MKRLGPQTQRRRGMALIIVLSSLVFLAALVVAFMSSVNTELRSSKRYADSLNGDLLSQTAFNLAITQITEGTRGYEDPARAKLGPPPLAGSLRTWASQPGMIRTYDDAGATQAYYRLYSWDQLRGSGAFDPVAEAGELAAWNTNPAVFTDLNEPVPVEGVAQYPILSPAALGVVEGFKLAAAPGGSGVNLVAMPVKWLYVLEDGQVVAPVDNGDGSVSISGAAEDKQIVGRIAFWADDDTGKVNINTASEGSYVDIPRTSSSFDRTNLAMNQPVNNEYQRYPGHPATTSLSTVFPAFAGASNAEKLYPITPRYMAGGSRSGSANTIAMAGLIPASAMPGNGHNRLYASVDEFVFRPSREDNDAALTSASLEQTKFFLTANSRAPELNLFNQPRLGIWPISLTDDKLYRTAHDRLIAFCLTMRNDLPAPFQYYFQRGDRFNTRNDLDNIPRNRVLLTYLRTLTDREIPGFGGNFAAKYNATNPSGGTERDQILTQIFDYIRCTNLKDSEGRTTPGFQTFAPVSTTGGSGNQQYSGLGEVVPIYDAATGTKGFGRFPTVSKVVLHVIASTEPSATTRQIEAGLFFEMFDPSQGLLGGFPEMRLRVSGQGDFKWGSNSLTLQSMEFPDPVTTDRPIAFTFGGEPFAGGKINYQLMAAHRAWGAYKLISKRITVPTADGQFAFFGGPLTIEVLSYPGNEVVQTIRLDIPPVGTATATVLPLPTLGVASKTWNNGNSTNSFRSFSGGTGGGRLGYLPHNSCWILPEDVVRSVEANPGDLRLIAGLPEVPAEYYAPHRLYSDSGERFAHSLRNGEGYAFPGATGGRLVKVAYRGYQAKHGTNPDSLTQTWDWGNPTSEGVALGKADPFVAGDIPGDWDNGFGMMVDGPFINKPDEGSNPSTASATDPPYFYAENLKYLPLDSGHFSANRQMPSAGMFGSLPTGVIGNKPWQTLQFRPTPAGHPNLLGPRDHLLLDLFHMPVVEPYAISEPLSTAGKVNLNYQIVPFTHITRETGIRAVLKSERVIAIPDASASEYKRTGATSQNYRFPIDAEQTLEGFRTKFNAGEIFRSASEICDLPLVPQGTLYGDMGTYWDTRRLTGDNSRERPYTTLYPRLTTRSNTFTIHVRAQALQKRRTGSSTDWARWQEGKDLIISEYRGNQTIERYVDPDNRQVPDYATEANPLPISDFYKIRVLASKQFTP